MIEQERAVEEMLIACNLSGAEFAERSEEVNDVFKAVE